jgi:hypothetical protein
VPEPDQSNSCGRESANGQPFLPFCDGDERPPDTFS